MTCEVSDSFKTPPWNNSSATWDTETNQNYKTVYFSLSGFGFKPRNIRTSLLMFRKASPRS